MNDSIELDPATHAQVCGFFEDYRVRSIGISVGTDIRNDVISQIEINFFRDADNDAADYVVSFKLLDRASDAHRYLRGIGGRSSDFRVQVTEETQGLGRQAIAGKVRDFIATIKERVEKIHKEQSILGTQPVGKIYILNNKSRFKVLADDGQGQLRIEIMDKEGRREARLGANDLLDGLYVGLIAEE
jgi:hypothetical protein